jgi:ribonuclease HI
MRFIRSLVNSHGLFNSKQHLFFRVGGHMSFPPPVCAQLQTDGSFKQNKSEKIARVGMYLQTIDNNIHTHSYEIDANSSIETEWASILGGIEFAGEYYQDAIFIENDCLSVISFFSPNSTRYPAIGTSARDYYENICNISNEFAFVGLRWIPREMNRADKVLRS